MQVMDLERQLDLLSPDEIARIVVDTGNEGRTIVLGYVQKQMGKRRDEIGSRIDYYGSSAGHLDLE